MKFLVLYMMPAKNVEEWMKTPEEERKAQEKEFSAKWETWMQAHGSSLTETAGAGKTKRVTADGVTDVKNDVMMFSFVETDSPEAAAELFKTHPHLEMPGGWIDIMPVNSFSKES